MAGCTRIAAVAVSVALGSGCVTGHLWQAGRRWERPIVFQHASVDGDRLVVQYDAQVSDDDGVPVGARTRRAALPLATLPAAATAAEDVRVHPLRHAGPMPGRDVDFETAAPAADGDPVSLLVHDSSVPPVAIPGNVFTRTSIAPWVYPLMPLAVCVDATSLPVLLFFAPGAIVIGD